MIDFFVVVVNLGFYIYQRSTEKRKEERKRKGNKGMVQGMLGPVRECNNSQPDYSQLSPGTTYHQFSQASLQQTSALLPTSPAAAAIGVYWGARRGASAAEPNWAPSRGPAGGRSQLQCRHARRPAQPHSPGQRGGTRHPPAQRLGPGTRPSRPSPRPRGAPTAARGCLPGWRPRGSGQPPACPRGLGSGCR